MYFVEVIILHLSTDGRLFLLGFNNDGQCGVGHRNTVYEPTEVVEIRNRVKIHAGVNTLLALSKNSKLFIKLNAQCNKDQIYKLDLNVTQVEVMV
jgi:alpha-tubulin suppressor-like RCC1 family protein